MRWDVTAVTEPGLSRMANFAPETKHRALRQKAKRQSMCSEAPRRDTSRDIGFGTVWAEENKPNELCLRIKMRMYNRILEEVAEANPWGKKDEGEKRPLPEALSASDGNERRGAGGAKGHVQRRAGRIADLRARGRRASGRIETWSRSGSSTTTR